MHLLFLNQFLRRKGICIGYYSVGFVQTDRVLTPLKIELAELNGVIQGCLEKLPAMPCLQALSFVGMINQRRNKCHNSQQGNPQADGFYWYHMKVSEL